MLDKIYEIFHERMLHKGKGVGIGVDSHPNS